ncbi:unnamed protein product [Adineta steineri]|uniref:Uncharacterized protein n=1 Tax=Adineta steineri TaxID=433720 RepID=A0A813MEF6_9BILA|nr:unnamed protein product [Adineta steineri]
MIFFSKHNNASRHSSSTEACVSILGLFIACGILGGLAALIYGIKILFFFLLTSKKYSFILGLVRGISSGTIGGGIVLGVSLICAVILTIVFVCCLKKTDGNSDANEQRSAGNHPHHRNNNNNHHHHHHHQQQHNRQGNHGHIPTSEMTRVSEVQRYDHHHHQQQPNGHDIQMLSYNHNELADSANSSHSRQMPLSPSKVPSSIQFNPSNSASNNQNRNNYNRH